MKKVFIYIINILYIIYFVVLSELFLLLTPLIMLVVFLIKPCRWDELCRKFNWLYNSYIIHISPFIFGASVEGKENIKQNQGPFVITMNHNTIMDNFIASLIPLWNQCITMRSWVYHLPFFGLWMRWAAYINVEDSSVDEVREQIRQLKERGVSFLFYPEGHRTRDGKLRRFHSGAFRLAVENKLPVLPVCVKGAFGLFQKKFPFLTPSRIKVKIMPPVLPGKFSGDGASLQMRKHVKAIYLKELGK